MKKTQTLNEEFSCPNCGSSKFKLKEKVFQCNECGHVFANEDIFEKLAGDFMDDLKELIPQKTEVNIDINLNKVKK